MGQSNSTTALTGTKIKLELKLAEQIGETMLIPSYKDDELLQTCQNLTKSNKSKK